MRLSGNTILITGGSEGIGFELAKALVKENTVIVCGRSGDKLDRARAALPQVVTEICDLTDEAQRHALVERVLGSHPELNVLINNAGGKSVIDITGGDAVTAALQSDTDLNYIAPVSLCSMLLGHLQGRKNAVIVNITSGLVFLPKVAYPFYCAAKAALHSYTRSLRWKLRGTDVRVFEVLMALADTNFHQGALPKTIRALSAEEASAETLRGLARRKEEIYIGKSAMGRWIEFLAPAKGLDIINRSH
jgi:uncharacterized oxidoreductase